MVIFQDSFINFIKLFLREWFFLFESLLQLLNNFVLVLLEIYKVRLFQILLFDFFIRQLVRSIDSEVTEYHYELEKKREYLTSEP